MVQLETVACDKPSRLVISTLEKMDVLTPCSLKPSSTSPAQQTFNATFSSVICKSTFLAWLKGDKAVKGRNGKPKPCYLDSLLSIHNQTIRMTLLYHVLSRTVIYCHASHMYPYTLHWDVHLSFTLTSGRILSLIGVLLCTCLATLGSLNKSRSSRDAGWNSEISWDFTIKTLVSPFNHPVKIAKYKVEVGTSEIILSLTTP